MSHLRLRKPTLFSLLFAAGAGLSAWAPAAQAEQSLLESARVLALSRGAGDQGLGTEEGKLAAGKPSDGVSVSLPARHCVVAAGAVARDVADVELTLRTPEGLTLADGAQGAVASLRYCAGGADEQLLVRARADRPTPFALGVWNVAAPGAPRVAPPPEAQPGTPPHPPEKPLSQRLAELAKRAAVGMEPMLPAREEDILPNHAVRRDLALEAEHCYRVLAATGRSGANVELALSDAQSGSLFRIKGRDGEAVLVDQAPICPSETGTQQLEIQTRELGTTVIWQLFGQVNAVERFPVGGKGDEVTAKRMRQLHKQLAAGAAVATFDAGELQTAGEYEAIFEARPGQCYVAIATGVPSLRALELRMLDQRGNEVAHSEQPNNPLHVRACADLRGRWTVRVRAFKGYGSFGLQVFQVAP